MGRAGLLLLVLGTAAMGEKVVLLAVEGLTAELLGRVATPAIDALVSRGSLARLRPEFPAETLPTLAAMATGQHSEVTGILDSSVWEDGQLLADSSPKFWHSPGSPNLTTLWGLGGRVGTVRWPGAALGLGGHSNPLRWSQDDEFDIVSDVSEWNSNADPVRGNRTGRALRRKGMMDEEEESTEDKKEKEKVGKHVDVVDEEATTETDDGQSGKTADSFNKSSDAEWRLWTGQVRTVVTWLGRQEDPVELVLMYVEEPGSQIRGWGPDSAQAEFAVSKVDQLVALLTEQLAKAGLRDSVNLLVTGVHGFTEVATDGVFDISSSITDASSIRGHSPVLNIQPGPGESLDTYARLQASTDKDKFDMYTRHLVPAPFHYSGSSRVAEIVLVAKEGFVFASDFWAEVKSLNRAVGRPSSLDNKYGKAGYDNRVERMQAVLIMQGPGLATQPVDEQLGPLVDAVDVFPLVCHLLRRPPPASNGSLSSLRPLLRAPPSQAAEKVQEAVQAIHKTITYYTEGDRLPQTVSLLAASTLSLLLLICCCACALRRRRAALGAAHTYKYSSVKSNRRTEGRVDGSEEGDGDKVGLLTSALMEEDLDMDQPA